MGAVPPTPHMKLPAALCLALTIASTPAAFATPVAGSIAFGTMTVAGGQTVTASDAQSWSNNPTTLNATAAAFLSLGTFGGDDYGYSNAYGGGQAIWAADGNSGTIGLGYGWLSQGPQGATSFATNLGGPNWSYEFVADSNGTFEMDYEIDGAGNMFGLWGFTLSHTFDAGSGAPVTNPIDPSSTGHFSGQLTAGQSYLVTLMNNGNVSGNLTAITGSVGAGFKWWITSSASVPDSGATATLLIGGLALLGVARRRR